MSGADVEKIMGAIRELEEGQKEMKQAQDEMGRKITLLEERQHTVKLSAPLFKVMAFVVASLVTIVTAWVGTTVATKNTAEALIEVAASVERLQADIAEHKAKPSHDVTAEILRSIDRRTGRIEDKLDKGR